MIKRTLYFGNPAYLSMKNKQLTISIPEEKKPGEEPADCEEQKSGEVHDINEKYKSRTAQTTIPIEDIGIVILDNQQVTITQGLLAALIENNTAFVTCSSSHMPTGMLLNLSGNNVQTEIFADQIESSEPLKKQLWQQTISAKISNQAALLKEKNIQFTNMTRWAERVHSGDPDNYEGRAAAYYWQNLFPSELEFKRDRYGEPPNNLLNYGYAILRAITARGLVASGLLPTLGIHHHNKYNAYCLADDIMEPYRPFVDNIVCSIIENGEDFYELTPSIKEQLLKLPVVTIKIGGEKSPLMVGMQKTTSSLAKCFQGEQRKIIYPEFINELFT